MSDGNSDSKMANIIVPLVVAVLGLIGVIVGTDWFSARVAPATPVPLVIPTGTESDLPGGDATATPVPLPLDEIFPQVNGGKVFAFVNNPAVFSSKIVSDECVHSGVYGLKLIYDIKNSGNGGWGVQWEDTSDGTVDLTGYSTLVFWAKGGTGAEYFQFGVKDDLKREAKLDSADLIVLTEEWQQVRVPLDRFGDVNMGLVNNINFDFGKKNTQGVLCIDDISLE